MSAIAQSGKYLFLFNSTYLSIWQDGSWNSPREITVADLNKNPKFEQLEFEALVPGDQSQGLTVKEVKSSSQRMELSRSSFMTLQFLTYFLSHASMMVMELM